MQPTPCAYLGTEMNGKWWKRYRQHGFFTRGGGTLWPSEAGFQFHPYVSTMQLVIPYKAIKSMSVGTWHAGRWGHGKQILKIHWDVDGISLCSGFIIGGTSGETARIQTELLTQLRLQTGLQQPLA